jgi:hypothetical protein
MDDGSSTMSNIHSLIADTAIKFETITGKKPLNVYLGEVEIKALKKWAYENEYITSIDENIRGSNRPEVGGLIVYAVNEITHIACA